MNEQDLAKMFPQVSIGTTPATDDIKTSSMELSLELGLACAMARVAFLGVALESSDPEGTVMSTLRGWEDSEVRRLQGTCSSEEEFLAKASELRAFVNYSEDTLLALLEEPEPEPEE